MKEIWVFIKGFEGVYQISNTGKCRSVDRISFGRNFKGKEVSQSESYGGYMSVQFRVDKKVKTFYIHRLVATHFVSGDFKGAVINHIDENKKNNCVSNLEFVTKSKNHTHSRIGNAFLERKLSSETVKFIRNLHKNGVSLNKISLSLNENSGTISNIINHKTYKNVL